MKTWHWIAIAFVAVYVCGILTRQAFIEQHNITVEDMEDTTWTATQIPPSKDTTITIPKPDIDIKPDSDVKDSIEVETQVVNITDSLLFFVNRQRYYQPFRIGIIADNFYGYKIMETPRNISPEAYKPTLQAQKLIKFYGNLVVMVDMDKHLESEAEVGILFKGKLSLFGRIEIDNEMEVKPKVGIKVFL